MRAGGCPDELRFALRQARLSWASSMEAISNWPRRCFASSCKLARTKGSPIFRATSSQAFTQQPIASIATSSFLPLSRQGRWRCRPRPPPAAAPGARQPADEIGFPPSIPLAIGIVFKSEGGSFDCSQTRSRFWLPLSTLEIPERRKRVVTPFAAAFAQLLTCAANGIGDIAIIMPLSPVQQRSLASRACILSTELECACAILVCAAFHE